MRKIDWVTTLFLVLTPLVSAFFVPLYIAREGWHWSLLAMLLFFWAATELAITAGYHRFFSHRSYETNGIMKALYLFFGTMAFEGSVLKWATDHRRHHRFVDTDKDPYNINKGFWWAHMGWMLVKTEEQYKDEYAPDLAKDRALVIQNKYYGLLAFTLGFGVPLLLGWMIGLPFGGLLFGGILRVVLAHHCTFFINSLCHTIGRQPYSDTHTARDSFLMALFTFGEGYHNFHHEFQIDYRNGVRWYQWDPTKWVIQLTSLVGWSHKLKTVPRETIVRAVMLQDEKRLVSRGLACNRLAEMKARVIQAQDDFKKLRADWALKRSEFKKTQEERLFQLKAELRVKRLEAKMAYAQWRAYVKTMNAVPVLQTVRRD